MIAVNVGGAVIPTLVSIYLLMKRQLWVKGLVATAIVALVIHWMAYPVSGLGIAVPVFVPVAVTAIVAMLLSREDCAPLAYIAGSLGTLIGADLTNLDKVRGLGAPVASIGGAGYRRMVSSPAVNEPRRVIRSDQYRHYWASVRCAASFDHFVGDGEQVRESS